MRTWHVVEANTPPLAKQTIEQLGIEVYMPEYVIRVRHGRRTELRRRPMLYQYMFACFDIQRDQWQRINACRGVEGIMCSARMPIPVPESQIDRVREMASPYDGIVCEQIPLTKGQVVQIIDGAFKDHRATVEEAIDGSSTVELQISLMGGPVPMRVSRFQVAPVA